MNNSNNLPVSGIRFRVAQTLLPTVAVVACLGSVSQAWAADPCSQVQLDDAVARYNGTVLAEGAQADAASVDSCYADDDIVTFTWNGDTSMTVVCLDDVEGCNIRMLQGSAATPNVWGVDGREDDGSQTYYHAWSVAITDLSIIGSAADDWISSLYGMSSATPSRVASGGGDDIVPRSAWLTRRNEEAAYLLEWVFASTSWFARGAGDQRSVRPVQSKEEAQLVESSWTPDRHMTGIATDVDSQVSVEGPRLPRKLVDFLRCADINLEHPTVRTDGVASTTTNIIRPLFAAANEPCRVNKPCVNKPCAECSTTAQVVIVVSWAEPLDFGPQRSVSRREDCMPIAAHSQKSCFSSTC